MYDTSPVFREKSMRLRIGVRLLLDSIARLQSPRDAEPVQNLRFGSGLPFLSSVLLDCTLFSCFMLFEGCRKGVLGCREHWSRRDREGQPQMTADASTVFITYQTPAVLSPVVLKLTLQRQTWDQRPCSRLVDAFLKAARPSILKAAAFSQGRAPRVEDVVD